MSRILKLAGRSQTWTWTPILFGALWSACARDDGSTRGDVDWGLDSTTSGSSDGGTGLDGASAFDATVTPDATIAIDASTTVGASVLEHHLHASRDGAYIDPSMTRAAAAAIHLDTTFVATVDGIIYGHPLYVDGWESGTDAVFVGTDHNHVTALHAATGAVLWDVTLGPQVPLGSLPCGPPYPYYGVFSTPIIDLPSRTLFVESFQTPDGGTTKKHYVYALSIDTGATKIGWPVDVAASVPGFNAGVQQDRGALALLNGTVYVPYAGLNDDCGAYNGWVVGISTANSASVSAFKTTASKGGIWGAIAGDGTSLYVATGNAPGGTTPWGDQEAILRLTPEPKFSGATSDYFTPSNWKSLDSGDADLGSSAPILFDMPGTTIPHLAAAMGKAGVVHLLNRDNLGGVGQGDGVTGEGLYSLSVAKGQIKGTAASYASAKGRYLVVRTELGGPITVCPNGTSGDLLALSVVTAPSPMLVPVWCAQSGGKGSPIATTTDGASNPLVWIVSTGGLEGLGTRLVPPTTCSASMATPGRSWPASAPAGAAIQHWTSPVEAKGNRIAVVPAQCTRFRRSDSRRSERVSAPQNESDTVASRVRGGAGTTWTAADARC